MQRLFAKFSISDREEINQNHKRDNIENKFKTMISTCNQAVQISNNNDKMEENKNSLTNSDIPHKRTADPDNTDIPKNKKVRQLKQRLRLCSSITCYIEQVLYSSDS